MPQKPNSNPPIPKCNQTLATTTNFYSITPSYPFASLIFFIIGGQVVWAIGLVMMVGQVIGAFLGSQMVVKGGAKFIRPVIVVVCFAMMVRYVFW